jgi:hypothetical protein
MSALKSLMAGFFILSVLSAPGVAGPIRPRTWQLTYWAPNQGPPPVPVQPTSGSLAQVPSAPSATVGNRAPVTLAPQITTVVPSTVPPTSVPDISIPAPAGIPTIAKMSAAPLRSTPTSSTPVAPAAVTPSASAARSTSAVITQPETPPLPTPAPVVPIATTPISIAPPAAPAPVQAVAMAPSAPAQASAPTLSNIPAIAPMAATAAVSAPAPPAITTAQPPPAPSADAFVNFGNGPYPEANLITTGNAQPWYNSTQVATLFGGQPTDQQRADFTNTVIQRVEQTFQLSGVPVHLTTDPTVSAAHTLSLVSHTGSSQVSNAIGMTDVGSNGFSFVDPIAGGANSVDQLEWVVAHNIAHELMLAFGVPETHDKTGNYIDALNANWSMLIDPQATFSAGATTDLLSRNFLSMPGSSNQPGLQLITPQPVPEPATWLAWMGILAVGAMVRGRLSAKKSV